MIYGTWPNGWSTTSTARKCVVDSTIVYAFSLSLAEEADEYPKILGD